jgi:hypothetical protein
MLVHFSVTRDRYRSLGVRVFVDGVPAAFAYEDRAQLFDAPHELLAFHLHYVALSRSSLRGVAPGERLASFDQLGERVEEV